jgi:hypothetical protein
MHKPDDADRARDDDEAAAFLTRLLRRPITGTTMRNWRYARRGPKPEYFANRPSYTFGELRRYASTAFEPQPMTRRPYRRRIEHGEPASQA